MQNVHQFFLVQILARLNNNHVYQVEYQVQITCVLHWKPVR